MAAPVNGSETPNPWPTPLMVLLFVLGVLIAVMPGFIGEWRAAFTRKPRTRNSRVCKITI